MATSTPPPQPSFRSRPLPQIPLSAPFPQRHITSPSNAEPQETHLGERAGPDSTSQFWPTNRRDTIQTITSIATTLPRYSTIDFSDPQLAIEEIDHREETNEPHHTSITHGDNLPPEYPIHESGPGTEHPNPQQRGRRPHFVLHKFHIGEGGNKLSFGKGKPSREPWATLQLLSRGPLPESNKRIPRFIGGDILRGRVVLRLDSPMTVHSIKLVLKAKVQDIADSVGREHEFLDRAHSVYSKGTFNDPRESGLCDISKNKEHDGTLHGSYSFSFSIPFPAFVELKKSSQNKGLPTTLLSPVISYDPPPSFREKGMGSAVEYDLGVVITHGVLRSKKTRATTGITFIPKKVSPPASTRRQAAYREGARLPGPQADSDGWHAVPAVMIQGQYRDRPVQTTCILWLAKPLSYTRGTVIPCYITLSSLDVSFLEALASPHAINLCLFRNLCHPSQSEGRTAISGSTNSTYFGRAIWWKPPKTDLPINTNEVHLEGEVHLPKNLVSSCDFPLFNVNYTLDLFPFNLSTFTPTRELSPKPGTQVTQMPELRNNEHIPLLRHTVDITSFHEHGPIPVAFTNPVVEETSFDGRKGSDRGVTRNIPVLAGALVSGHYFSAIGNGGMNDFSNPIIPADF